MDDIKSLRYGKVMIMTDQDQDGSHIKGLVINFIHHNWPGLLKLPFLEEFITPIVKVTKGNQSQSFTRCQSFRSGKRQRMVSTLGKSSTIRVWEPLPPKKPRSTSRTWRGTK